MAYVYIRRLGARPLRRAVRVGMFREGKDWVASSEPLISTGFGRTQEKALRCLEECAGLLYDAINDIGIERCAPHLVRMHEYASGVIQPGIATG